MNDFLQFINTASIDSLTKISGISQSLAENLIATRPFDTIEDCLKVRGMGKNLLARAQSAFEALEPETKETAMISTEEKEPLQIEKSQLTPIPEPEPKDKPSFGKRAGQVLLNVFRALLRLLLLVILIGGVGAGIYYGVPYIREKFITPVEQNAARVNELENQIATLQTQLAEINNQLTETNNQLAETNTRVDEIKQSVETHTASLEKLAGIQTTLEVQIKESNDKTLLALKHEVLLTRALDTLARARLYLAQSNFGLAKEDVQSARDLLEVLKTEAPDEVLTQVIARLDLALGNLPAFPVVASGDLEIAWQILITGEAIATSTPEPASTTTGTPLPEPTVGTTPTATATP
ncbi:MAG: helix-hairpin-helix domain-containing protein [Chloroflexota bacterium]